MKFFNYRTLGLVLLSTVMFFTSPRAFAQTSYTWKSVAMGGGGYVTGIVAHPDNGNLVYIRTDVGGAYRWDATNKQWIPLNDMFSDGERPYYSVDGIAVDPNDQNVVYMCAGNSNISGIFKSTNKGKSWVKVKSLSFEGNGQLRQFGEPIQVDPNNSDVIYSGSRKNGLVRSTDGGATWATVSGVPVGTSGIGIRSVTVDKSSTTSGRSKRIYVAVYGKGIYMSSDGGSSFSYLDGSPSSPSRIEAASNGVLYVTYNYGVKKYVSGSWKNISPASYVFDALDVAQDDPDKIIVGADRSNTDIGPHKLPVYYSTDGGSSWTAIIPKSTATYQAPWYTAERLASCTASLMFDPSNSKRVYITDWYQVMRTEDITASTVVWNQLLKNLEEMCVYGMVTTPRPSGQAPLVSFVADNKGFRHSDVGYYPTKRLSFTNGKGLDFCESNPNYMFGVSSSSSAGNAAYSTDNGSTWNLVTCPYGSMGKVAYSATNTNLIVVVPKNHAPVRSTDRGATWSTTSGAPSSSITDVNAWRVPIASDRVEGKTFYFLHTTGDFYRSTDGGASWDKTANINVDGNYIIKAVPGKAGEVWVAGNNSTYRSTNHGSSFTLLDHVYAKLIAFGKAAPGRSNPTVYIYGNIKYDRGVFRSIDNGATWERINTDSQQMGAVPTMLEADREVYGKVYLATRGRGIYYLSSSDETTTETPAAETTTSTEQKVTSFTLINADNDQPIQEITNGSTLDLASLPTRNLNIKANTNTTVGSLVFNLSGTQSKSVTENIAPYTLIGDDMKGDYYDWTPSTGSYTLKATPYSASSAGGSAGTALSISFTITDEPSSQQITGFTLVNASTGKAIQTLTNGATLNLATLPTKSLNIIATTDPTKVGSLAFSLSGAVVKNRLESAAPYALFGDNNGVYISWTPKVGSYTLKATPYAASGGGGAVGTALTVSFTVINQSTSSLSLNTNAVNETISMGMNNKEMGEATASLSQNYPNPFIGTTTISYSLPATYQKASILINDPMGRTLQVIQVSGSGSGSLSFSATTLAAGTYYYSLVVDNKIIATKQMIVVK